MEFGSTPRSGVAQAQKAKVSGDERPQLRASSLPPTFHFPSPSLILTQVILSFTEKHSVFSGLLQRLRSRDKERERQRSLQRQRTRDREMRRSLSYYAPPFYMPTDSQQVQLSIILLVIYRSSYGHLSIILLVICQSSYCHLTSHLSIILLVIYQSSYCHLSIILLSFVNHLTGHLSIISLAFDSDEADMTQTNQT